MGFLRAIFKWLVALIVAYALLFIAVLLGLSMFGLAFQRPEPGLENGSVLVYNLDLNVTDTPAFEGPREVLEQALSSENYGSISLLELLDALRAGAHDDRISGLVLTGNVYGAGYGSSLATLREVRRAIEEFKASGKPVWAYVDMDGAQDFYLKSAAQEVYMNPFSYLEFKGLASETPYLGDFLRKYGVGVQVARSGKFKSAAESLVEGHMSPEERTQRTALLNDIWLSLREDIGESREVEPEKLAELANDIAIFEADDALDAGLVDSLLYRDEMANLLVDLTGPSERGTLYREVSLLDYANERNHHRFSASLGGFGAPSIAIVYAEGVIVEGPGVIDEVGADTMVEYLREVRRDPSIKALVMRVNSPGGSATASEKILREVRLVAAEKPVIVSMGGMAASGGYWISSMADTIFAEPTTITGSIGVISMIPNVGELAAQHEVNFETVRTSRFADLYSISRPRTPEEMALMQQTVDKIYQDFLTRVSEGRELSRERVNQIAQGRVWSGESAVELRLVDYLGGLEDAIAFAAEEAGLGEDYTLREYPERVTLEAWFEQAFGQQQPGVAKTSTLDAAGLLPRGRDPVSRQLAQWQQTMRLLRQLNDPMGVYAIEPQWVFVD
ncbi:MAG: signal peptide peptidase SppA [Verrucomicrobiota bacterium JB022]|nr:signal peptide peptidase SppA [Verrucomicrobiota bacterium JB022]